MAWIARKVLSIVLAKKPALIELPVRDSEHALVGSGFIASLVRLKLALSGNLIRPTTPPHGFTFIISIRHNILKLP